MTVKFDLASLRIEMSNDEHSISEIWFIVDALDNISMGGIWAALADPSNEDEAILSARNILHERIRDYKAPGRFYPNFHNSERSYENKKFNAPFILQEMNDFDPFHPMDSAIQSGLNSWLRKEIYQNDRSLFNELFGFARVHKLEQKSPLVIELALIIAASFSPIIITYGIMRSIHQIRKSGEEIKIREAEAEIKKEELKQKKIQTEIMEEIKEAIKEKNKSKEGLHISEELLKTATNVTISSVSELSSNPLINNITFGVSSKT